MVAAEAIHGMTKENTQNIGGITSIACSSLPLCIKKLVKVEVTTGRCKLKLAWRNSLLKKNTQLGISDENKRKGS